MNTNLLLGIVLVGLGVAAGVVFLQAPAEPDFFEGVVGSTHLHADFKVYLEGEAVDFSLEKYQSGEERVLSNFVHLHDGEGGLVHVHDEGITLGFFFETLGMTFNRECFVLDSGEEYCNDGGKTLRLFVNGELEEGFADYLIEDEDRVLITYGNTPAVEIQEQLASVSDKACIYSETCPERGPAPPEASCVGRGNCVVEGGS